MAATNTLTTTQQLATALHQARHSRHHPDCRCGNYQHHWCTQEEWRHCITIDTLLETLNT